MRDFNLEEWRNMLRGAGSLSKMVLTQGLVDALDEITRLRGTIEAAARPHPDTERPPPDAPRCTSTFGDHRCDLDADEHTQHEADNAAEGGATLVWTPEAPAQSACDARCVGRCSAHKDDSAFLDEPHRKQDCAYRDWRCDGTGPAHKANK